MSWLTRFLPAGTWKMLAVVGSGIGALLAAATASVWLYGEGRYRDGKAEVLEKVEESREDAAKLKEVIDDEVENLTGDDLVDRALGWVRGTDEADEPDSGG